MVAAAAAAERRRWAQEVRLVFYLLGKTPPSERERGWDPGETLFGGFTWKAVGRTGCGWQSAETPPGPLTHKSGRQRVICSSLKEGINHMRRRGAHEQDVLGPWLKLS